MFRTAPLLLAAATMLPACEEGTNCNLMYAPDGVDLSFEADVWAEGEWTVEVDGLACTVTLPGTSADIVCDPADGATMFEITLSSSGDAIEGGYLWDGAPDPLEIVVSLDGTVIYEEGISPDYDVDEPNGPGCGERSFASVDVVLD